MAQQARIDHAALDKLLDPYDRTNAPGFAVGVALRGVPAYRRGVGMASIELPVALSPTIRMRIGSTTKHFCVLAVMLLAEEGKLSIDASPRRTVPELPEWAEAITLRQLMAHRSGMRDSLQTVLVSAAPGQVAGPDILLKTLMRIDSVDFAPGTSWSYNNGGYVLLSEIVERVSGQSLADFLYQRILEPIGMYDSMLRLHDTDLVPNSATLHVPKPGGGWTLGVFPTPVGGMGGMVSTVDDMLLWLKHMSHPVIGSAETWAAMRTPLTTNGYGLGLSMEEYRGLQTVHHGGTVFGGRSQMLKVLEPELDVAVMTNGLGALELYGLVDAIVDACIPGLPPIPGKAGPDETGGTPSTGTFYSAATGRVMKLAEHEGKQLLDLGGAAMPTRRQADGALTIDLSLFPYDLRVTPVQEDGAVAALAITEFGGSDRLRRVEPPADASPVALAGRYEAATAGMSATIMAMPENGATFHLASEMGALDYTLVPVSVGVWQAKGPADRPLVLTLEFDADGLRLSDGRIRRLRFVRAA